MGVPQKVSSRRQVHLRRAGGGALLVPGLDDLDEAAPVEAGATDKHAVNVRLAHEFACVLRVRFRVLNATRSDSGVIARILCKVPK